MCAASVAVVVTSGERDKGKAGMVLFAGKLYDPCLSALYVPWCKKALYKHSSFPFLSTGASLGGGRSLKSGRARWGDAPSGV